MAEDIKGFIEKIQQEGIRVAEEKAGKIQEEAQKRAEEILREAKLKAEAIFQETKEKIAKMEANQRTLLKQAGRDFLLTMRQEIDDMLKKIILAKVKETLSPEALLGILTYIIKETLRQDNKAEIIVTLKPDDLKEIKPGFQGELATQIKKGIVFKPQDDIGAGFMISYDSGKSQFDFTDKAFAEFISSSIKPQLEELLKDIT